MPYIYTILASQICWILGRFILLNYIEIRLYFVEQVRPYNTDLNLLNCDDYEDEDGCIYTYKEGAGFEDNILDHLLNTCVSCGLPNFDPPPAASGTGTADGDQLHENNLHFLPPLELNDAVDNNVQENNLFSPDMDFLEMDFDPGSNADELESSDCDDNCFPEMKMLTSSGSSIANRGSRSSLPHHKRSNNLSPERRTLMLCRRCETDSNVVGKVGNLTEEESDYRSPFSYLSNEESNYRSPFVNKCSGESNGRPQFSLSLSNSVLDDRPVTIVSSRTGAVTKNVDQCKLNSSNNDNNSVVSNSAHSPRINNSPMKNSSVICKIPVEINLKPSESIDKTKRNEADGDFQIRNVLLLTKDASMENNLEQDGEEADDEREENSPTHISNEASAGVDAGNNCLSKCVGHFNIQSGINSTLPTSSHVRPNSRCVRVSSDITVMATPDRILICNTGSRGRRFDGSAARHIVCPSQADGKNGAYQPSYNMNKDPTILASNRAPVQFDERQHQCNNSTTNTNGSNNNNLGSLSAPEVSPAHEYQAQCQAHHHHDRFKRSVSFHNQLSSPKYDNVGFLPHKNNLLCHERDGCRNTSSASFIRDHQHNDEAHSNHNENFDVDNLDVVNSSYLKSHRHSHPCNEHDHRWHTSSVEHMHGDQLTNHSVDSVQSMAHPCDGLRVCHLNAQHNIAAGLFSNSSNSERSNNINTISDNKTTACSATIASQLNDNANNAINQFHDATINNMSAAADRRATNTSCHLLYGPADQLNIASHDSKQTQLGPAQVRFSRH